jgi:hypothetical protein
VMSPSVADDEPIPLRDVPALYPRSRLTVAALRAEAGRGRLKVFRIGRRDYVTIADVRDMIDRCRDADSRHVSTSIKPVSNGQSSTERISSAQAALMTNLKRRSAS